MTKRIGFIFIFTFLVYFLNAQDFIYMTSGEQRSVIVKKVGVNTIEYLRFDNQQGALYEVSKAEVSKIIYQNGVEDIFQQVSDNQDESDIKNEVNGDFLDVRDSTTYKYVVIGKQTWMAENLRYALGKSLFNSKNYDTCDNCGRYYNYNEALIACPDNWHLPTDDEWIVLEMQVGMLEPHTKHTDWRGNIPGQATSLLKHGNSGLDMYLCGFIYEAGYLYVPHLFAEEGFYWTSSQASKRKAYYRHFAGIESIQRSKWIKSDRFTVRCIKD